jgi:hypothetical protein
MADRRQVLAIFPGANSSRPTGSFRQRPEKRLVESKENQSNS